MTMEILYHRFRNHIIVGRIDFKDFILFFGKVTKILVVLGARNKIFRTFVSAVCQDLTNQNYVLNI